MLITEDPTPQTNAIIDHRQMSHPRLFRFKLFMALLAWDTEYRRH